MGKNQLDLIRKMKKYDQNVKLVRRGITVRINDISSKYPDFAIGPYQVKMNSTYILIINPDLSGVRSSQDDYYIQVDFWAMQGAHLNLEHLNQGKVSIHNRETRLRFHTYPKTKYIFITFKLVLEEHDDLKHTHPHYNINYVYIDSKHTIPRSNTLAVTIPNKFTLDYNIECHPHTLMELELEEPLKDFDLPINMDVYQHALLTYLLQKENSPKYLEILKQNIKNGARDFKNKHINSREIDVSELIKMRSEIKKNSDKLERNLMKVDNLINHKHSLENLLDDPNIQQKMSYGHKNQQKVEIYEKFLSGLNLKLNHLEKLKQSNQDTNNLNEDDKQKIQQILDYYHQRVLFDKQVISNDLNDMQNNLLETNNDQITLNNKMNQDQEQLDMVLTQYRKLKETCSKLKKSIDEQIIQFINHWYHYILQLNDNSVEY